MKKVQAAEQSRSPEQFAQKLASNLIYWQKQLRLDGLDIRLQFNTEREEDGVLVGGECVAQIENNFIIIRLCPPEEMENEPLKHLFCNDYEVILVHELLHGVNSSWQCGKLFNKLTEDDPIYSLWEQSIHTIAEALVRARRGITR